MVTSGLAILYNFLFFIFTSVLSKQQLSHTKSYCDSVSLKPVRFLILHCFHSIIITTVVTTHHFIYWKSFLLSSTSSSFSSFFIFLKLHTEMIIHASLLSLVRLFAIRWISAHQAPLSTEFSKQEYWSGLPFPSPGDLPDPWIKPVSPLSSELQADSLLPEPSGNDSPSNHNFPERWTQC